MTTITGRTLRFPQLRLGLLARLGLRSIWWPGVTAGSAAVAMLALLAFLAPQLGPFIAPNDPSIAVLERPESAGFASDANAQAEKYGAVARVAASGDAALPDIRSALASHTHDATAKYWLVVALGEMGRSAAARELLGRLTHDPDVDIYAASFLAERGDTHARSLLQAAARDISRPDRAAEASDLLQ